MVLTAAHCLGSFNAIQFNRHNLSDESENFETFGILDLFTHRRYSAWTDRFDVMLIKLNGTVSLVDPIRINDSPDAPENNEILTVVGWGGTDYVKGGLLYPDTLQEVDVFYIPNEVCETIEDEDGVSLLDLGWLYPDMMCAGDKGKDSCNGDSGSPLIARGSSPEEDIQVGIVSWGFECAGPIPGIYSRLSHASEWIRLEICRHSDFPPSYMNCDSAAPTTPQTGMPSQVPSSTPSDSPSTRVSDIPSTASTTDGSSLTGNLTQSEPLKLLEEGQPGKTSQSSTPRHSLAMACWIMALALTAHAS